MDFTAVRSHTEINKHFVHVKRFEKQTQVPCLLSLVKVLRIGQTLLETHHHLVHLSKSKEELQSCLFIQLQGKISAFALQDEGMPEEIIWVYASLCNYTSCVEVYIKHLKPYVWIVPLPIGSHFVKQTILCSYL